jgi:hypothetical protein
MLFFYLLLIVLIVFNMHTMIQPWRVWIGTVPLNLMEFGIVLVILSSFILPTRLREPIDERKRNYLWLIIALYSIPTVVSTIIGIINKVPLYNVFQMLKISLKLPAEILCGYMVITNLTQVRRTIKFTGFLCALTAVFVMAAVARGSAIYISSDDVNKTRTVAYNTQAAGIFVGFLVYSAAVNRGYFSRMVGPYFSRGVAGISYL